MGRRETIFELLRDYEETFNRPVPISYDLLKLSDDHRKFDALIRRFWDNLHPLSRDVFTSFANEIQYLLHLIDENQEKLKLNNEEVLKIKDGFEQQLEKFEMEFDNRVTEGIATVSNRNFDLMDRENRSLKETITSNESKLQSKEELIENLRYEISLLIDDSKEQEDTAKNLEENISESINQFNSFTSQLDVFEDVMDTLQSANIVAERQIDNLSEELEFKAELFNEVKTTYQKSLELSEQRYEGLKDKIKQISPQIQKVHETSKILHQKNNELKIENEKLKNEYGTSQEFENIRDHLGNQIDVLKEENRTLENQIDHLIAEIDMMKIKKSQQDDILSGYKSMVFESKSDTATIPVPTKHKYNLNPGQVKQPKTIESMKQPPETDGNKIPKIKPIPERKITKVKIAKPLIDQAKEIPKVDQEDEEEVKQIIKKVLIGKGNSAVKPIPSPRNDDDNKEKSEKSKKSSTKEKLFS
ncbi:MAG: hypothetical protein GPJ54_17270 [Candidatus Heimdallarchaeota archaeon]|nr:hypothetical protein [Candidatus Heimdallarchaeota archaeon]